MSIFGAVGVILGVGERVVDRSRFRFCFTSFYVSAEIDDV